MAFMENSSELATRVVVGFGLVGIAGLALYLGGAAFWLFVILAAYAMQSEWAGLVKTEKYKKLSLFALTVPLAIMSPYAAGPTFLALGLIFAAALFVVVVDRSIKLASGLIYVGIPVLALIFLRAQDNGLLVAFWAMSIVWATDIGAYFAGRAIGGAKLAPSISPNKTWAGLGGGVVAAWVLALVLHYYFGLNENLVWASGFLAVAAQMGDLFESHMKRQAGVKDSGTLLPGHGGALDRLDGLVPVAPLAAVLVLMGNG